MKKDIKVYNALFPLWMLLMFPESWIIVLPGNFIIDSIVLIISMWLLKIDEKLKFYRKNIFIIFCFGILSDIIGSAYMLILSFLGVGRMGDEPYLTIPALLISGACIFVFNYYITFKKYDKRIRFRLAMTFAIVTAPYTFLVPSSWLYG